MSEELAIEILKQATIETTTGACKKCPRKDKNKTCIGCLDEAKEKILLEVERLGNELQVQIEDNTRLNEYIEVQDKKLEQKENIIKEVRETLINSQEYKMAKAMNLTSKMSVLIEIKDLLDKENKE